MAKNNKGRIPIQNPTPKTIVSRDHTVTDPLIGWLSLAKPYRNRQQKRGWQRGARK